MPETPEQLEELFLRRLAARTSAATQERTPTRYYDAEQSDSSYESRYGDLPRPRAKHQEMSLLEDVKDHHM